MVTYVALMNKLKESVWLQKIVRLIIHAIQFYVLQEFAVMDIAMMISLSVHVMLIMSVHKTNYVVICIVLKQIHAIDKY